MEVTEEQLKVLLDWLDAFSYRDFSKRQSKILGFLLRFVIGSKNGSIYIPNLADFELCGVHRTKIRKELEVLEESKVIFWNRGEMTFYINPNVVEWKIPEYKKYRHNRYLQLLDLNRY